MSILRRVRAALKVLAARGDFVDAVNDFGAPQASHEAGRRFNPRFGDLPGEVLDATEDITPMDRVEIMRKSRYHEKHSPVMNRMLDLLEQYCIGEGLTFVPDSSDPAWNRSMKSFFNDWQEVPDVSSRMSFAELQTVGVRGWAVDGDHYIKLTSGKPLLNKQSWPRVQLYPAHQIETPFNRNYDPSVVDGVRLDDRGRPIAYFASMGQQLEGASEEIPADMMVPLWEHSYVGQVRGYSLFAPVLRHLGHLDDLMTLELDAAKANAEVIRVAHTQSGELPPTEAWRERLKGAGTKGTTKGSDNDRNEYYIQAFRGKVRAMMQGDKYDQFSGERPSDLTMAFWDHITTLICAGFGVSKLLVLPYSLQGTVTRADLDVASAFFRSRASIAIRAYRQVYQYVAFWAKNNVRSLADPPMDFRRVKIRAPRCVNVDVGRNSQALIAEYEAGWRTLEEICGELGKDWVEVLEERARELRLAREIEGDDLPPGSLIKYALEALKQQVATQQPPGADNMTARIAAVADTIEV